MPDNETNQEPKKDKKFLKGITTINGILNQLSTSLYGTDTKDETEKLNERFNKIMETEINNITKEGGSNYTSFLGKLFHDDADVAASARRIENALTLGNESAINPSEFINERYRNRMIKQADAHEIAGQLIELQEAKATMRDGILSADTNTGRINRKIVFDGVEGDNAVNYIPMVEAMEQHFDTPKKIKDFIVDQALDFGEYYVYTIPYHLLFSEFSARYNSRKMGDSRRFYESADPEMETISDMYLAESADEDYKLFVEGLYDTISAKEGVVDPNGKKEAYNDIKELCNRVTINTHHVPIPILENGIDALKEFQDLYITEDGDRLITEEGHGKKEEKSDNEKSMDNFLRKYSGNEAYSDGLYGKQKAEEFEDLKDCYIKMIDPTRLIPVEMMGTVLFYIYIQTDDDVPLHTILSYTSQLKTKDPSNRIDRLIDEISSRIVSKFDKKFVQENKELKQVIASALEYYELGDKKIHFQVIPKEYITEFKINQDMDGHGHSMLEPSLFYAKLYLMILMFKIVTIITKSNDQTINYLRTSGIDKNVFNKAQEIARRKAARRITLNDMFSYTGVLNKVAAGSEIFMPMGKNNEKPIETEILQGQSVEMNSDLLEQLRTNYILGTGVPSAIMNYLNEADFAKSIETANTKLCGRIMSYQIDLNAGLTDWYRKLLRFSTNMPESVINSLNFILPEPKGNSNIVKQELLNNYSSIEQFLVKIFFGESPDDDAHVKRFTRELAKIHLPMINFTQFQEIYDTTKLESVSDKLNGDEIPDVDF